MDAAGRRQNVVLAANGAEDLVPLELLESRQRTQRVFNIVLPAIIACVTTASVTCDDAAM